MVTIFESRKTYFIFLLMTIFLFSLTLTNAQPPFIQPTQPFIDGYILEIPEQGVIKAGQDFTFFFHVFNITNGLPLTGTLVNCEFNLHDSSSSLIHTDTSLFFNTSTTAFSSLVLGSNFTVQEYTYVTHCNSTDFGGFISVGFDVTTTGETLDEAEGIILFAIILILILVTIFFVVSTIVIKNEAFKIFLGSMSVLMLISTLGFGVTIMQQLFIALPNIVSGFSLFFRLFMILLGAAGIGLVIFLVVFALKMFNKSRGLIE